MRDDDYNKLEISMGTKGQKALLIIPATATKPELKKLVKWIQKVMNKKQPPQAKSYFDLSPEEQKQTVLKAAKESSEAQQKLMEQSPQAESWNSNWNVYSSDMGILLDWMENIFMNMEEKKP